MFTRFVQVTVPTTTPPLETGWKNVAGAGVPGVSLLVAATPVWHPIGRVRAAAARLYNGPAPASPSFTGWTTVGSYLSDCRIVVGTVTLVPDAAAGSHAMVGVSQVRVIKKALLSCMMPTRM